MGFEKYVEIIERIDQLIRMRNTGTPEELAHKLGISVSWLHEYIDMMKARGADIEYDRHLQTYHYINEGEFDFSFRKKS